MLHSQLSTPATPKTPSASKNDAARVAPSSDTAKLDNKIRERAHQLYESRGREPGKEHQDWAQAEHEILNQRP